MDTYTHIFPADAHDDSNKLAEAEALMA